MPRSVTSISFYHINIYREIVWTRDVARNLIGNHLSSGSVDWIDAPFAVRAPHSRLFIRWWTHVKIHGAMIRHNMRLNSNLAASWHGRRVAWQTHYAIIIIIVDFYHLCNIHHVAFVGICRRWETFWLARSLVGSALRSTTTRRNAIVCNSMGNLCNYSHCIVVFVLSFLPLEWNCHLPFEVCSFQYFSSVCHWVQVTR